MQQYTFFQKHQFWPFLNIAQFFSFLSTVNSIWGCCVVGHSITKNEARSSGLYEAKSGKTSADIVNPKGVSQLIANLTFLMYSMCLFLKLFIYLSMYLIQRQSGQKKGMVFRNFFSSICQSPPDKIPKNDFTEKNYSKKNSLPCVKSVATRTNDNAS